MTKPFQQASDLCVKYGEDFVARLFQHMFYGWVYSGEDCFVMATEENRECLLRQNLNEKSLIEPNLNNLDKDTWFIYVYAGNLKRVLELIPHRRKFVAFRRDMGKIKVYEMEKLLDKLERL